MFPDAVIILSLEDEDVIKRILPSRLAIWRAKMKAKKDKRKVKAAKKKAKLMQKIKERRDEEIAKYEEARKKREEEVRKNSIEALVRKSIIIENK